MPVEAVLLGAGLRGRFVYGRYALAHPDALRIVAVAEPDDTRRAAVARDHGIPAELAVRDWRDLLARPRLAPVAIVATSDTLHVEPALAAIDAGYHLLLEKPIAPDAADCARIVAAAGTNGRILQIAHVLRYAPFYGRVHEVVASGRLGRLLGIHMQENVAWWHYVHSYVRGKFRNRKLAAPIVLAKTCHDLDLMIWFAGARPRRVASFGELSYFRRENAPSGAPRRCSDGCPAQAGCTYDALRFYLTPDDRQARWWPHTDLSPDPARAARRWALERGPYGVCVYRADNDVPDHQVLAVEFENGIAATFTLNGVANEERRTVHLAGTEGELRGVLHEGWIEVRRHGSNDAERIEIAGSPIDHFGGDPGLLEHFTAVAARGRPDEVRASGAVSLESHLLGFAAEESRLSGRTVELDKVRRAAGAA
jgi:predicted dehydrogenase